MPDPQKIDVALNASIADNQGRVRIIVITTRGGGQHRFVFDDVMPANEANDLLLDIREQADNQLQKLWPEPEGGRHRG